jgi:hypothetical protein
MSNAADIRLLVDQQVQAALAAQAAAAAAAAAPKTERPRLPPPPFYSGGAAALDDWFSAMEQQITWYGSGLPTDAAKLTWIGAYLQGAALDWWKTLAAKPTTVTDFAVQLRARFQPVNSAETARAQMLALTQGKSGVQAYVDAFRRLLVRDMAESDRLFQFLRGLNPTIATQIKIQGVTALNAAIDVAVRVGSLMEHGMPVQHRAAAASSSHAPMELDNIEGLERETGPASATGSDTGGSLEERFERLMAMYERKRQGAGAGAGGRDWKPREHGLRGLPKIPHLSPNQVKEYMDAGKCFECGQTGHSSRNCPSKKEGAGAGRPNRSN